ncbi:MAG: FAD-dependent oxidoreductase [Clostridiales bacterium]|nr:FAD-dependent oxidoreductase [Clostridiales bacterium]
MKKLEADIVVIAAGASGLTAAVSAAEKDASVIVFEKGSTAGGAANMGMGPLAVNSHYQKEQMVNFSVDDAYELFMDYTHWRTDGRLVRKWLSMSASTIDWLETMGVEFLGAFKYFKTSNQTWHIIKAFGSNKPAERAGSVMVKALTDRAEELGVEFHYQTPVKKIMMDEKGRVVGVIATDANGEEIQAECSCVIIATGGFGDNPKMIKDMLGFEWGKDLYSFRIPGVTGDGINMAWEVGAGKTEVTMEMTYTIPGVTDVFKTLSETMRQPNLMVNIEGKRFFNEQKMSNTVFTGNAVNRQTGRCAFSIIGDSVLEHYRKQGLDYVTFHHNVKGVEKWETELKEYLSGEVKSDVAFAALQNEEMKSELNMYVADSIEELAEKTGIDAKELKKTIEEYNAVSGKYDPYFDKDHNFMVPITGPKYYAARHFPAGYGSLGGIKTNDNLQVVTQEGKVIPGLYSCGTDACSIFGDSYCFLMPGSTMSFALNSGRIAGTNAVDYIDSDDFVE